MPIYLQWLDTPSEQDCVDLEKLYADAPADWLSDSNQSCATDWASTRVACGDSLALGRFNDRIVCAAWVVKAADLELRQHSYEIKQLCVRSITRERGVAKQLLVRLCQWAGETQSSLYIADEAGKLSNLYELGFVQYLQGWRYTPL